MPNSTSLPLLLQVGGGVGRDPGCEDVPVEVDENKDSSPILLPSPTEGPCADPPPTDLPRPYWVRAATQLDTRGMPF